MQLRDKAQKYPQGSKEKMSAPAPNSSKPDPLAPVGTEVGGTVPGHL